jgi:hypothetical protein
MREDKCMTDKMGECCCTCRYHVPDCHHPDTTGKSMSEQRGWVCLAPEFDCVFSGWGEHGACEMYAKGVEP